MLRQHSDGVDLSDSIIQVLPDSREESVKDRSHVAVRPVQQSSYSGLVAFGDAPDVCGPLFPVAWISVLVDYPCQNRIPQFNRTGDYQWQGSLNLCGV